MIKSNVSQTERKSPSSLNSQPFSFGPSVQVDLFNYLKPAQRKAIRPFLQIIKRPYQEKLCISLMDYLEGNGLNPISQPILRFLQNQIIEECSLHPLTTPHSVRDTESHEMPHQVRHEVREPKSIGALIKQLFPGLSSLNHHL